jgi:hypothetical protein
MGAESISQGAVAIEDDGLDIGGQGSGKSHILSSGRRVFEGQAQSGCQGGKNSLAGGAVVIAVRPVRVA